MFQPVKFGKYLLVDKIARGGMAEIYLAKLYGAEGFEKDLVVKMILPEWSSNQTFLNMLIDEAKLAVRLNHANIVPVFELGQENNRYYIAMEYVDGVDLRRLWSKAGEKEDSLPLNLSLYIMIQVLEGLSYAHNKKDNDGSDLKIIHRDISPQNILISFDGAVKLTDFGIAKATLSSTETASGIHKGKYSYMSPEQANLEQVGQPTDIFSAGIILFELVAGRRLFGGGSDIQTLDRVRKASLSFSPEEEKRVPADLVKIIRKMLARDPDKRFKTAFQVRKDLFNFSVENDLTCDREDLTSFLEKLFHDEIGQKKKLTEERRPFEKTPSFSSWSEAQVLVAGQHGEGATATVPQKIKSPLKSTQKERNNRRWLLGIFGGIAVLFLAAGLFFWRRSFPPPPPASNVIASPAVEKDLADITVLVIPWGTVTIDGKELGGSPVRKHQVTPGNHNVQVYYAPENLTLTAPVKLNSGQHVKCLANFEEGSRGIRCRVE